MENNTFNDGEETSSIDVYLTVGLVFLLFLAINFINMRPENTSKANVKSTAQFTITMEWENNDPSDVDLYVQNPLGQICFFNNRDFPLTNLDRDDRGDVSDTIQLPDGGIMSFKENKEVISIRGLVPGEYIVNVHQFAARSPVSNVKGAVEKLNPSVRKVFQKDVQLTQNGQEIHICRFVIDENGDVIDVNDELPIELVRRP